MANHPCCAQQRACSRCQSSCCQMSRCLSNLGNDQSGNTRSQSVACGKQASSRPRLTQKNKVDSAWSSLLFLIKKSFGHQGINHRRQGTASPEHTPELLICDQRETEAAHGQDNVEHKGTAEQLRGQRRHERSLGTAERRFCRSAGRDQRGS